MLFYGFLSGFFRKFVHGSIPFIMKKTLWLMATAFVLAGCAPRQPENPLLASWKTPFEVPPFEIITWEHYQPAFEQAMTMHNKEIAAITENENDPDFDNTLLALDQSGQMLRRVGLVFFGLNSAHTNDSMQAVARRISPLTTRHWDDIWLNPRLFKRVRKVYENRENDGLDAEKKRLTEETYKQFIRSGAGLPTDKQERLRELNKEINMLQIEFGQNLLAENNGYRLVIDNPGDLAGLPEGIVQAAVGKDSSDAGKWTFTLHNPSVIPFLQYSSLRELREKMFHAYINRGNNNNQYDNKEVVRKLIPLRLEKARLLGYNDFATYVLEDRMAKTPANVYDLLNRVWEPALTLAKKERTDLQALASRENRNISLEGWDWRYYNEKVVQEKFSVDEESLRPYFLLENVRDGIFNLCNRLYGISFTEIKDAPVYHPDVTLWECRDADGSHLGVLYLDFFPRPSKRSGAWCGSYRSQTYHDGFRVAPVSTIVCNFTAPAGDKPSLLTPDETETFFHEFGHALHGLFRNVKYNGLASVPRDFVELPSQIMEHWVFEPQMLREYARHYQTGEVIPEILVEKIRKSARYGQGFKTTEYVAASFLDMDYHTDTTLSDVDVLAFEAESMKRIGLIPQIPPRYRTTYFQHTMTGGYTAGYYSYLWSEVLDADAYQAFVETGDIFDKATAGRFRKSILEKGGSRDAMEMYIDFRGKEPSIEALLENRGLK